ncbi:MULTISPECIES: preprotein translocase subunit SecE [Vibrio]|jgi:preprotein translocase subunit SecE|uniref:Protein translocase subunit SecE n=3 Tax=Vibrio TaxID=662 RepID=A0A1R4LPT4_VIBR1|nr:MULTISPECIES: preprotein translocase subunit SecE [Vibrio]ASA55524.1 preprotein translocase subunit SecE [Vibrio gazogenes]KUI97098.1 preprotein translocase subunit SecE [Vibrio sp. MEBiC08052]MDW6091150.1 preprotein translocase subunit SecE [Vibrio rhizosphaerae]WNJ96929.1 preprotein translocase subunit SecE [Vibrio ruber]SJN58453.1 preprotein translocase subunit SecE [Vibrio ruber DSM 16370]
MKANHAETPESSNAADKLKWLIAIVLLAAAVVGNSFYGETVSVVIRSAGVIVLIAAALGIAAITVKGKEAVSFAREARMEIRKVIWPTRQETVQTTLIVLAVCVVMALALWGIDGIMVRLVAFATGV